MPGVLGMAAGSCPDYPARLPHPNALIAHRGGQSFLAAILLCWRCLYLDQADLSDLAEPLVAAHQRHRAIHRCRGDSRVRDLEPVEPR